MKVIIVKKIIKFKNPRIGVMYCFKSCDINQN